MLEKPELRPRAVVKGVRVILLLVLENPDSWPKAPEHLLSHQELNVSGSPEVSFFLPL